MKCRTIANWHTTIVHQKENRLTTREVQEIHEPKRFTETTQWLVRTG